MRLYMRRFLAVSFAAAAIVGAEVVTNGNPLLSDATAAGAEVSTSHLPEPSRQGADGSSSPTSPVRHDPWG